MVDSNFNGAGNSRNFVSQHHLDCELRWAPRREESNALPTGLALNISRHRRHQERDNSKSWSPSEHRPIGCLFQLASQGNSHLKKITPVPQGRMHQCGRKTASAGKAEEYLGRYGPAWRHYCVRRN